MSMALENLRLAVQGNLGYDSRGSDFNRWVNQGLFRIASRWDFMAMMGVQSSLSTAESTGTGLLLSTWDTNFKQLYTFTIQSGSGYQVIEMDQKDFDYSFPYASNDSEQVPRYFIRRSSTTYDLYPVPDGEYAYTVRFSKWPTVLTADSDTQPYEAFMDQLVIASATLQAYESFQESQDIMVWMGNFERLLREAIAQDGSMPTAVSTWGKWQSTSGLSRVPVIHGNTS